MTHSEVVSAARADPLAGAATPGYRAYAVDRDGRLSSFVAVEARDDADAVWLARALAEFYPVELWRQGRVGAHCLGRFGPGG